MASVATEAAPRATSSWAADLQAYERTRRREVDVGFLKGPPPRLRNSTLQHAARAYDPVLQSYRDGAVEQRQRALEEQACIAHLNRAKDLQLRREQQHNIVTHEGHLDPLRDPSAEFVPVDTNQAHNPPMPGTFADYNIISNLPMDEHHWNHPDCRPGGPQRAPKQRLVPVSLVKDFNVITNRYLSGHEAKTYRDRTLNLLEATETFRRRNFFDPVKQRFTDERVEANARAIEDALTMEGVLHAQGQLPPSFRGRASDSYDLITHEVKDEQMLRVLDAAEDARNERYRTKHAVEMGLKERDSLFEAAAAEMLISTRTQGVAEAGVRALLGGGGSARGPGPGRALGGSAASRQPLSGSWTARRVQDPPDGPAPPAPPVPGSAAGGSVYSQPKW